jgi:phage shock protein A
MSLKLYSSLLKERELVDRRIRALRVKIIRRDAKNLAIRTDEFMDLFNHLNNLIYNLSYSEEFYETLDKLEEKIEEFYAQLAT